MKSQPAFCVALAALLAAGCQTSRKPIPLDSPPPAPPPPLSAGAPAAPIAPSTPVAGGVVDMPAPSPAPQEIVPAALLLQHHGVANIRVSENTLANLVKAQLGSASFHVIDPRNVIGEPLPKTTPADLARKCGAKVFVSASVTDARVRVIGGSDPGYRAVFELMLSAVDAATGMELAPVNVKRESRIYLTEQSLRADEKNIWEELARATASDASKELRARWAQNHLPASAATVRVTFAANVPGAVVRVGGIAYGTIGSAPLVLSLPEGVHPVQVDYPGYRLVLDERAMLFEGASFAVALTLTPDGQAAYERDKYFRLLCERIQRSGLTEDLTKELVARGYASFLAASRVKLEGMPNVFIPVGVAPVQPPNPAGASTSAELLKDAAEATK